MLRLSSDYIQVLNNEKLFSQTLKIDFSSFFATISTGKKLNMIQPFVQTSRFMAIFE